MRAAAVGWTVLTLLAAAQDAAKDNTPPSDEFELLFTGRDLENWISDPDTVAHWVVKDGELHADGKGGNLVSERNYRDFELLVDWSAEPGSSGGIFVRGRPKIAIVDPSMNDAGSGGLVFNKKDNRPAVKADKAAGEWNSFEIRVVGGRVTVRLNDQVVVDDVTMDNAYDYSRKLPFLGRIELEAKGPMRFKNIYLRPLKSR
jgi:hypothetical protein